MGLIYLTQFLLYHTMVQVWRQKKNLIFFLLFWKMEKRWRKKIFSAVFGKTVEKIFFKKILLFWKMERRWRKKNKKISFFFCCFWKTVEKKNYKFIFSAFTLAPSYYHAFIWKIQPVQSYILQVQPVQSYMYL